MTMNRNNTDALTAHLREVNVRLEQNLGASIGTLRQLATAVHRHHTNRTSIEILELLKVAEGISEAAKRNWGI
jgi:hypothetical protein